MDDSAQRPPEGSKRDEPESEREDLLRLASLAAHQLRSPLDSIQTLLSTVIGGFVGPVDPRQRQLLEKAVASCGDGIHLVADLMRLRSVEDLSDEALQPVNMLSILESVRERIAEPAREKEIEVSESVDLADPRADAWVRGDPGAVEEILFVLADNAVKYTPPGGRVRFALRRPGDGEQGLEFVVSDTGIGIPPELRDQVFDEFFRAPNAKEMTREGTGLGLAFARRAAERLGGVLRLEAADGGGTRAVLRLESTAAGVLAPADAAGQAADAPRPISRRVVIIGGVAAGSKVAAKVMRLDPAADVTVVERGRALSYAGCGLPYYISGVVARQRDLISTPLGEERDSSLFHDLRNVRTLDLTEAVEIDRQRHKVRVRSLVDGRRRSLTYDVLVLATGASPVIPKIAGIDLAGVYTLHGVESAEAIKEELRVGAAKDVVIVGAGLLGSEITESVAVTGARVSLVERQERVMGLIDPDLALLLERRLSASGVKIATRCEVQRLEGDGRVQRVVLGDGRVLACDFVILAAGVEPNVDLAVQAGLELGPTGAVAVDQRQLTSDPRIYAVGDCAEQQHLVTGERTWIPMGSTALKQARVAAINLCGGDDRFEGVVGSTVIKIFDQTVARTGLGQSQARQAGFDPVTAIVPSLDCAHYIPTARPILLKVIVDRASRRVLGVQGIGEGEVAKRVDVAAVALSAGMSIDQLSRLDLCFAPPYALAIDSLLAAGNIIRNKLDGLFTGVSADELRRRLDSADPPFLLDVRLPSAFDAGRLAGSVNIPLGSLRGRLHELPTDRPIVLVSRTGLKSYEAALILADRGFAEVSMLDGGLEAWPWAIENL